MCTGPTRTGWGGRGARGGAAGAGRRLAGVPEGDVVWRTARRLHEALAGRVLTRCDVRVPRFATADLTGQTVTEAISRGKHLLIRTDAGVTVHTHLRMDGSWRGRPARRRGGRGHPLAPIPRARTREAPRAPH